MAKKTDTQFDTQFGGTRVGTDGKVHWLTAEELKLYDNIPEDERAVPSGELEYKVEQIKKKDKSQDHYTILILHQLFQF